MSPKNICGHWLLCLLCLLTPLSQAALLTITSIQLERSAGKNILIVKYTSADGAPDLKPLLTAQHCGKEITGAWAATDKDELRFESEITLPDDTDVQIDISRHDPDIFDTSALWTYDLSTQYELLIHPSTTDNTSFKPLSGGASATPYLQAAIPDPDELPYKEYPSIIEYAKDRSESEYLQLIRSHQEATQCQWVVTEKLHGSLLSFTSNGKTVRAGKHHGWMEMVGSPPEEENLYKFQDALYVSGDDIRDKIKKMFAAHCQPGQVLVVYGEHFGNKVTVHHPIQYACRAGSSCFRAFDIMIDEEFVDFETFKTMTETAGIERVPVVTEAETVPFEEALAFQPERFAIPATGRR